MRDFLLQRSILLLVLLVAPVAVAKKREPVSRFITVTESPRDEVSPVYVAGEKATVLRFSETVDAAKTKMMGWEGRFEPLLAGGHFVVVTPLKDLEKADRFLLVVTLQNGKEVPFTVTAQDERFDHQVDVFLESYSPEILRTHLEYVEEKQQKLEKENERLRSEESSIDHALAALLAKGAWKMTPFRSHATHLIKNPEGAEFTVSLFASKNRDKFAVLIDVKNNSKADSWGLLDTRVITETGGEKKPYAMRASRDNWEPGGTSGSVAVVMDASVFESTDISDRLVVELFRKGSGLREVWVFVDRSILR